ncbi:MAG: class I SAM-dependent methyltransferase family protein [Candidatus Diapherotrites archaeon]
MKCTGIKVPKKDAQHMHNYLSAQGLLQRGCAPVRMSKHVIFPLVSKPNTAQRRELGKMLRGMKKFALAKHEFASRNEKPRSLKEALQGRLKKAELGALSRAFDALGNIAVIEVPKGLVKKETQVAQALMLVNPQVKTVLKKTTARRGEFRVQGLKVIGGEKNFRANYAEHGCKFVVDLDKVFFTPRLGTERGRIAKLIKPGETVSVLFAGAGPYAIVFAKHAKPEKVFAVELNPHAVENMKDNIRLNHVQNLVVPIEGDVRKIAPVLLRCTSDRVVMPLPKNAGDFLGEALECLKKKGGVVHFYHFGEAKEPFAEAVALVKKACRGAGRKCRILRKAKCRSYSPDTVQAVVDFKAE